MAAQINAVPLNTYEHELLPAKLWSLVFGNLLDLDRKTLAACCRVSQRFWSIASPILYRRINFSVDPKNDSRHTGAQVDASEPLLDVIVTERKKKLLSHARVLTIDAHWDDMCTSSKLDLTAVSTLKICCLASSGHSLGPIFHVSPGVIRECAILKTLEPKKLVFDTTFLNCLNPFPRGIPKGIYQHIEELVFICPISNWRPDSPKQESFPPMPQLKRIVLMFYTPDLKNHWQQGEIKAELALHRIIQMYWNLQDIAMVVVNGGSLYAHMVNVKPWNESDVQSALRREFDMYLSFQQYDILSDWVDTTADDPKGIDLFGGQKGRLPRYQKLNDTPETREKESYDKLKLEIKKNRMQFVTMKEYLQVYDWEGELESDEVERWLKEEEEVPPTKRSRAKNSKQHPDQTSSGSIAKQLPFPREVLNVVFSVLFDIDRASLPACCLVSRAFFDIAAPVLYRQICVTPSCRRDSRADYAPDKYTDTGRERTTTRKKKLLKAAEIVTFEAHHATWCGNKSFKYPKLKTLVLDMDQNGLGSVLHSGDILEKQCSYVRGQAPKKLVLKRVHLCRISSDMLGVPEKLFDTIEELTFICSITDIKPGSMAGGFGPMKNLKKVVWIFDTPSPQTRWTLGTQGVFGRERDIDLRVDLFSFTHLISYLPDVPFIVVNAGSIDHQYFRIETWNELEVQDKFINMVKSGSLFGSSEIEKEKYADKFGKIKFLTMREYVGQYDWTGELEPKQVRSFLA